MSIFEAPIRLPLAKKSNRLKAEKKKHKLIQNHRMVVYMNIKKARSVEIRAERYGPCFGSKCI